MDESNAGKPSLMEFIRRFVGDWASLISGGLSVPFAILSVLSNSRYAKVSFAVLAVVGILIASYRLWAGERERLLSGQQALTEALREAIAKNQRQPCLRVHTYEGSCFTLITNTMNRNQLEGMHVNLDLAIENCGNKGSTISRYDLYVSETDKTYEKIRPNLVYINLQGRYCVRDISNEPKITKDGLIRLEPETVSPRGFLPFFPLDAPTRISGPLHCRLTLTDTDGHLASQDFQLREV